MLIEPTEHEGFVTSSYIDSVCVVLPALFTGCTLKAAFNFLVLALLLIKIITITVMETTTLMIKVVARELIDVMYNELCMPEFCVRFLYWT